MKSIKKIFKAILMGTLIVSLLLTCAERADGSCDLVWSLSWLAVAVLSGTALDRLGAFDKEEQI